VGGMDPNILSGGNDDMVVDTVDEEGKDGPISLMVEVLLSLDI